MGQPLTGPDTHVAAFYRGAVEYVAAVVPFVRDGVCAGESVTVAVPGENLALLREECVSEGLADRVRWLDLAVVGRNPGHVVPTVLHPLLDGNARAVIEVVWAGRSQGERAVCARHEAVIDRLLDGADVRLLCPYDAGGLAPEAVADARRTHRVVLDHGVPTPSAEYAPAQLLTATSPLPAPPAHAEEHRVDVAELAVVRRRVGELARRHGLTEQRAADVALVVTELVTNSIEHGGGEARLRTWTGGRDLVCEVADHGTLTDPLAGLLPAPPGQPHGRGLLLVNALADLVDIHSDAGGTVVRVHFARHRAE